MKYKHKEFAFLVLVFISELILFPVSFIAIVGYMENFPPQQSHEGKFLIGIAAFIFLIVFFITGSALYFRHVRRSAQSCKYMNGDY